MIVRSCERSQIFSHHPFQIQYIFQYSSFCHVFFLLSNMSSMEYYSILNRSSCSICFIHSAYFPISICASTTLQNMSPATNFLFVSTFLLYNVLTTLSFQRYIIFTLVSIYQKKYFELLVVLHTSIYQLPKLHLLITTKLQLTATHIYFLQSTLLSIVFILLPLTTKICTSLQRIFFLKMYSNS